MLADGLIKALSSKMLKEFQKDIGMIWVDLSWAGYIRPSGSVGTGQRGH